MAKLPAFIPYLPRGKDHTTFRLSAHSWAVIPRLPNQGSCIITQIAEVSFMNFPLM